MASTFTWLHFSDLHWGSENTTGYWATVKKHLFDDIKNLVKKHDLTFDSIFFTGDLVNKGTEFDNFNQEWLSRFESFFKDELKMENPPLFLAVPGNHDLARPDEKDNNYRAFREGWQTNPEIQKEIWEARTETGIWQLIQQVFSGYSGWWLDPGRPMALSSPGVEIKHGLLPGEFACTISLDGGYKIGVIGLNSSFLQLDDGKDKNGYEGKIDLDPSQLTRLLKINYDEWFKEHTVSFLLTHHPPCWYSEVGRNVYNTVIFPEKSFKFHFCGHMHENIYTEQKNGLNFSERRVLMGTSLFSMEPYREEYGGQKKDKIDRRHGYSIGQVSFEPGAHWLKIWPRKYFEEGYFTQAPSLSRNDQYVKIPIEINASKNIVHTEKRKKESSFSEKVKTEILAILKRPKMKSFVLSILRTIAKEQNRKEILKGFLEDSGIKKLKELIEAHLSGKSEIRIIEVNDQIVDDLANYLILLGCLEGISLLDLSFSTHKDDLASRREGGGKLITQWSYTLEMISWLTYLNVDMERIKESKASLGKKYQAVVVSVPVKTDMGAEIYFAVLNETKPPCFFLGPDKELMGINAIPVEKAPPGKGWSCDAFLRHIIGSIYHQIKKNRFQKLMKDIRMI